MKTNVIQLEIHDDVISIEDKMAWQSCRRIILVWPKRGRILHNELELVLLNRKAESLGAELALVTHHPVVCEWALDSKVPLFASISAAEKSAWKMDNEGSLAKKFPKGVDAIRATKEKLPQLTLSKLNSPLVRKLAISVSLAALILLLLTIIPQAEVTYTPEMTLQEIEVRIKASEVFSGINPSGNIPEKPLYVEVSGEKSMASSGKVTIPTTKAVGKVVFTNLTKSSVTLPVGILLLSGNETLRSYILTEEVVVPAGVDETAVGQVEAMVAGSESNLPADSKWTLSGGMDALVSVNNPDSFNGGGGVETPSPNEVDYAVLERQLLTELMAKGLASLKTDQAEGVALIDPSLTVDQILQSKQVNPIGEPADEAVLRMNIKLKVYAYQENDLNAIANLVLSSNQPAGYRPLSDDIRLKMVEDFQVDDFGQSVWKIRASRILIPDWNSSQAAIDLTGKKVVDAQIIMSDLFAQSSPATIKTWLPHWPWMPFLSTNIHFVNGLSS